MSSLSTTVDHSSGPSEDVHLFAGEQSQLISNSPNPTPSGPSNDETSKSDGCCGSYCEQGCGVCLIYSCLACDTRDCCPDSTICDCYFPAGAGLFLWVIFTFIYDLYDVVGGTANVMEIIVYSFEMFACDVPIMIIALLDKAPYLKYTFYTQVIASVAHTIVCIIEIDGAYNGATFNDGLSALIFDVPFEYILALILIPLYKQQVPLWGRSRVKQVDYATVGQDSQL